MSPAEAVSGDVTAACTTIKTANRAMLAVPGIVLEYQYRHPHRATSG